LPQTSSFWQIHHGGYDLVPAPWADPNASAWHVWQFRKDPPAVVEVTVPGERVQDRYQQLLGPQRAAEHVKTGVAELSVGHPVPADWVVGYELLARDVYLTAAAGFLGIAPEELVDRVRSGHFPRPRPPRRILQEPYWELEEFLEFLDSDQLRQLKLRIAKTAMPIPRTPS
jgi:hypothetical protein